jgi:hypothetical protein
MVLVRLFYSFPKQASSIITFNICDIYYCEYCLTAMGVISLIMAFYRKRYLPSKEKVTCFHFYNAIVIMGLSLNTNYVLAGTPPLRASLESNSSLFPLPTWFCPQVECTLTFSIATRLYFLLMPNDPSLIYQVENNSTMICILVSLHCFRGYI